MIVIDNNTVVIMSASELKTVLEGNNSYSYIYFGANIKLTSGITIAASKTSVVIDGTYQTKQYTYEDMNSSGSGDTISVRYANIQQVTVKNMNVIGHNYYGLIYVVEDNSLQNVVIIYENISYQGPQITFHPTGLSRYLDCNIEIIPSTSSAANEVAECNRIEIGGNTTIYHTSTIDTMFWFRGGRTPYFIFLEGSQVSLTSVARELFYGVNNLSFQLLNGATVSITTKNGMGYGTYSTNQVLIDKQASLTITQTAKNGSNSTWYCNGSFIMNETSSLIIKNQYPNISNTNYTIYFKTANASLQLNNPKKVILYNAKASVFYTDTTIPWGFTYGRINLWKKSADIQIAGSLKNLPDNSWYLTNKLSTVNGTFSNSKTTITSSSYTVSELENLPSMNQFQLQGTQSISIGVSILDVNAIATTSLQVSGYTVPNADVQITERSNSKQVTADATGYFSSTLSEMLSVGATITFLSNLKNSFIYQTKTVQVVYPGELTLTEAPTTISFQTKPYSTNPILCARQNPFLIKVTDTRINSTNWKLYAVLDHELISTNGYQLTDSLVFISSSKQIVPLSKTELLIYQGTSNGGDAKITEITYPEDEGVILSLMNEPLEVGETYTANITWNLKE